MRKNPEGTERKICWFFCLSAKNYASFILTARLFTCKLINGITAAIPLSKRFGKAQTFSREYILDSKWFGTPKPLRCRYSNREGGKLIHDIFTSEIDDQEARGWQRIGFVELTESITSESTDHRLHFHHLKLRGAGIKMLYGVCKALISRLFVVHSQ
jgi:hypothetical protein